jgi:phosphoglycerate kinase
VAIVGGAKVSDKIQVLRNLAEKVDTILVGGGMVAAFYVAQGKSGGAAEVTDEDAEAAKSLLNSRGAYVVVPADVVTAPEFSESAPATIVDSSDVPKNELILDIGPRTAAEYTRIISLVNTIIWNGPMGVFEWPEFAKGTEAVAKAVAANEKATSVLGGGSTAEVVGSYRQVAAHHSNSSKEKSFPVLPHSTTQNSNLRTTRTITQDLLNGRENARYCWQLENEHRC